MHHFQIECTRMGHTLTVNTDAPRRSVAMDVVDEHLKESRDQGERWEIKEQKEGE